MESWVFLTFVAQPRVGGITLAEGLIHLCVAERGGGEGRGRGGGGSGRGGGGGGRWVGRGGEGKAREVTA